MKQIWKEILMAILMGMILPGILLNYAVEQRQEIPKETVAQLELAQPVAKVSIPMKLRQRDGTVTEMDMDEYLAGVVLAELPASFELEAKKAQAVAARTFTLKASLTGGKHGDGSVCADPACCQAYISPTEYLSKGGTDGGISLAEAAVMDTSGYVLTYDGELIEATYFSCSGGSTEDAVAVWGSDFPYLRATDSPGEEAATHYTDRVTFSGEEFADALGLNLAGSPKSWLGMATYTAGGGINSMFIGGQEFKGTELRSKLGLRSTDMTMTADENGITIVTKGFGHRVGMSQYGADAMALAGSSYEEILAHYYQGTILAKWEN